MAQSTFDLIITRFHLPDGRADVLLSADEHRHSCPVLVLPGHDDQKTALEAIQAGVLDFIARVKTTRADHSRQNPVGAAKQNGILDHKRKGKRLLRKSAPLTPLFDAIPDEIIVKDTQGRFVFANLAGAQALHAESVEAMLGKTDFDFLPSEQAQHSHNQDLQIMHSGQTVVGRQMQVRSWSGRKMWISATKVPWRDNHDNILGLVSLNREITPIKQAEKDLERQHQLLCTLLDALPEQIFVKDAESTFVFANRQCVDAMTPTPGQPLESIIGKTDLDLLPRAQAQQNYDQDQHVMRTGAQLDFDGTADEDQAGRQTWMAGCKVPWRDSNGDVIGVIGVQRDVIEEKLAQEQLTNAQTLLLAAIEQMPAGVVLADARSGDIRIANSAAQQICGESLSRWADIPNCSPAPTIPQASAGPQTQTTDQQPTNQNGPPVSQENAGPQDTAIPQEHTWQICRADGTLCMPEDLPLAQALRQGKNSRQEQQAPPSVPLRRSGRLIRLL